MAIPDPGGIWVTFHVKYNAGSGKFTLISMLNIVVRIYVLQDDAGSVKFTLTSFNIQIQNIFNTGSVFQLFQSK